MDMLILLGIVILIIISYIIITKFTKLLIKIVIFLLILLAILILCSHFISGYDYYGGPMNFPPNESRFHTMNINITGNISIEIPSEFNVTDSGGGTYDSGRLNFTNNTGVSTFTVSSPSNCSNGDLYYFRIYQNNNLYGTWIFQCIYDEEVVDSKVEIGHGDWCYLDSDRYIDNDELIFSIIRVWPVGNDIYNEVAKDVTFNCTYPGYRMRTTDSKMEFEINNNYTLGKAYLDEMEGISLFRIWVNSQYINDKSIGDWYNITCTNMTFEYDHTFVRAVPKPITLKVRDRYPFNVTTSLDSSNNKITYTIKNIEQYQVRDINLEWELNNYILVEKLHDLEPNETVKYDVYLEGTDNITLTIKYTPEWYFNCRDYKYLEQTFTTSYSFNSNPSDIVDIVYRLIEIQDSTTDVYTLVNNRTAGEFVTISFFGGDNIFVRGKENFEAYIRTYNFNNEPEWASYIEVFLYDDEEDKLLEQYVVTDNGALQRTADTGVYKLTIPIYNYTRLGSYRLRILARDLVSGKETIQYQTFEIVDKPYELPKDLRETQEKILYAEKETIGFFERLWQWFYNLLERLHIV